MLSRKFLLFIGVLCVFAGLALSLGWYQGMNMPSPQSVRQEPKRPAQLVALRPLPAGTLLRFGDIGWKEVAPGQAPTGNLLRGQATEAEFMGAITRRDFGENEPLVVAELLKPGDRQFLAAVLKPGYRAVSISVDAPQSSSGLVLPGDFVDVILTQSFSEGRENPERRAVGETVLTGVRVVAVDQSLGQAKAGAAGAASAAERLPKTITLELTEQQAQGLFVAMQLGKLQIAVRALEGSGNARIEQKRPPVVTWASDISPAIRLVAQKAGSGSSGSSGNRQATRNLSTGSPLERQVRWPPPLPQDGSQEE